MKKHYFLLAALLLSFIAVISVQAQTRKNQKQPNHYGSYQKKKDADARQKEVDEALKAVDEAAKAVDEAAKTTDSDNSLSFTVNGVSFKMITVQGGTFMMGATSEQQYEYNWEPVSESSAHKVTKYDPNHENESPAHKVTLNAFSIGETEVTQALWEAVMGSNPSNFKGDNNPVETVSWDDCQEFITKLNEATKYYRPADREFRLPTEAEWEFAARGGNKSNHTQYAGGSSLSSVAWYGDNSAESAQNAILAAGDNSGDKTHPVAQKKANELGLYDMSGNVWEWCQDWFDGNYYSRSPSTNPCNNTTTSYRVDRGGSWYNGAGDCRVANRDCNAPGDRITHLGLRLAL